MKWIKKIIIISVIHLVLKYPILQTSNLKFLKSQFKVEKSKYKITHFAQTLMKSIMDNEYTGLCLYIFVKNCEQVGKKQKA